VGSAQVSASKKNIRVENNQNEDSDTEETQAIEQTDDFND
jgi:hypothetical protein